MKKYKLSVVCHLFYPLIAQKLITNLKFFDKESTAFFFNVQNNSIEKSELIDDIRRKFPDARVISSSSKGRDIGAKLLLIDLMVSLNVSSDYTLIIHDKKSPHLEDGDSWRDELFKIVHPKYVDSVFHIFQANPEVGIVGSAKYIENEYDQKSDTFLCSNNLQIKQQLRKYAVITNDYNFVAGNTFWIRTDLLRNFFKSRPIIEIREGLENGNALDFYKGTNIHAWERIMSWIATSQGYKIYGI